MKNKNVSISLSANLSSLKLLRDQIRMFMASLIAGDQATQMTSRLVLAVDEVIANIIEHGQLKLDDDIRVQLKTDAEQISVEVVDRGVEFNPLERRVNVEAYYKEGREDGLGLLALKNFTCVYERSAVGENHLTISKKWSEL